MKQWRFGETVKTENELIELLYKYLDNNCEVKEEYRERINGFFPNIDRNNCERIYNEVMKWKKSYR